MSQSTGNESLSSFQSGLDQAPARFLSRVIQHTLENDWQTPDDFVQHFGPDAIIHALAKADALRAKLLIKLANVHERIAQKKSIESATEDLRLALEEGIANAEALIEHFPADDRVRYLKGSLLWNFMFAEPFHKTTHGDGEAAYARSVNRMTFLLQCAIEEGILTLEQIADGFGFECLAERLPVDLLRKVFVSALRAGRRKDVLNEGLLFDVVPLPLVMKFMPLDEVWQRVILDRLAKVHGWVDGEPVTTTESSSASSPPRGKKRNSEAPPAATPSPGSADRASSTERPPAEKASSERASEQPQSAPSEPAESADPVEPRASEIAVTTQEDPRLRAIQRLKEVERLPPRHEELSTPILLSIESMYEELLQAGTDEERSECIRESFPNEAHLRTAMFALAELLEPSIDVTRPPICDADTDALVKLVVFEERKRKDGDGGMRRASVRPPPLPMGRSASSIPAARKNER